MTAREAGGHTSGFVLKVRKVTSLFERDQDNRAVAACERDLATK
jgi:hypothetical protein